jgi:branched-chain amino acid aminotransferase
VHAHDHVWLDGELLPLGTATVSVLDHGITVGDGVFETLKVLDGQAFALRRHLQRLRRSASGLGLEVPTDDDVLRSAVATVLAANRCERGRVRITVTGGPGPMGSNRDGGPPSMIIASTDLAPVPSSTAVAVVSWRRNEHSAVAGLKTTSYAENVVALAEAHRHQASEALMANTAGALCEGTGSNVFVVLDGRCITPTLASGCLAGITRELVLEALPAIEESDLALADLERADEAFLTSSTRDVQAIARIGDRVLDAPGPWTQQAASAFDELSRRSLDP